MSGSNADAGNHRLEQTSSGDGTQRTVKILHVTMTLQPRAVVVERTSEVLRRSTVGADHTTEVRTIRVVAYADVIGERSTGSKAKPT